MTEEEKKELESLLREMNPEQVFQFVKEISTGPQYDVFLEIMHKMFAGEINPRSENDMILIENMLASVRVQ